MSNFKLSSLAIPSTCVYISVLGYGSQLLFYFIEPGPLEGTGLYVFNALVGCIWISYAHACLVDPGTIPESWRKKEAEKLSPKSQRWCRKCDAPKPPRAHHCKVCKKCVPKMDHHCPWTGNCVSHRTFPHFIRVVFFDVVTMIYLTQLLFARISIIWDARHLPSYLGPSAIQLACLFILATINGLGLFAVGIIFIRTVYSLSTNVTAIESWEIERHAVLARRARKYGGYLEGADGSQIRIVKQEFPYDIGIWQNICQGMGSNPLTWFLPINTTPSIKSGLDFETNDFNDPGLTWPPPDPDKMPRATRPADLSEIGLELDGGISDQDRLRAFKERQEADLRRRVPRPETWKNSEGEALDDFGVDEETEQGDESGEDDIPIAELLKKRRNAAQAT